MKTKYYISIFYIVVAVVALALAESLRAQEVQYGTGSVTDPLLINNKAELIEFRDSLAEGKTYKGVDFSGSQDRFVKLTDDIAFNVGDVSDPLITENWEKWQPFHYNGSDLKNLTFNGNGHTLSGLYLDTITIGDKIYSALFPLTNNCTMQNLGIINSRSAVGSNQIDDSDLDINVAALFGGVETMSKLFVEYIYIEFFSKGGSKRGIIGADISTIGMPVICSNAYGKNLSQDDCALFYNFHNCAMGHVYSVNTPLCQNQDARVHIEECYYNSDSIAPSKFGTGLSTLELGDTNMMKLDYTNWFIDTTSHHIFPQFYKVPHKKTVVSHIEIVSLPNKLWYVQGDELDITGLNLELVHSDNARQEIDLENVEIIGFSSQDTGACNVLVKYTHDDENLSIRTASFDVLILAKPEAEPEPEPEPLPEPEPIDPGEDTTGEEEIVALEDLQEDVLEIYSVGGKLVVEAKSLGAESSSGSACFSGSRTSGSCAKLNVYDSLGRVKYSGTLNTSRLELNLEKNSIYFVEYKGKVYKRVLF